MADSPRKSARYPPLPPQQRLPSAPSLDDDDLLPPLAVPLGYGSGAPAPLPHTSAAAPALPIYRQQFEAAATAAYHTPPLPAAYTDTGVAASPPQPLGMQRPHRTFHQMYQQPRPQSPPVARARAQCASVVYFVKLLLFNILNGALGVGGFVIVTVGLTVSLVTLPLCCFGVVLMRVLLRVVYVLCKLDAVLHNVVADPDERIQFGARLPLRHVGHSHAHGEHHALLPTHIAWQLQPHHSLQDDDQLPQFEASLSELSPRAVLATIYFGSIKFLVGIFSVIAVSLVGLVLAVFVGGDDFREALREGDVSVDLDDDPLTVYLFALGLAVFAVAMLFANARISQAITRFFCCEGGL